MPEVRLIDANAFLENVLPECKYPDALKNAVENQPTIEAEPVRHGRWAKAADKQYCTECRAVTKVCNAPFCWHCGAQMDMRTPTEVQLDEADDVMMGGADNG